MTDPKAILALQRQLGEERHQRLRAQMQVGGLKAQNQRLRRLLAQARAGAAQRPQEAAQPPAATLPPPTTPKGL
jgi:hypothetical protein